MIYFVLASVIGTAMVVFPVGKVGWFLPLLLIVVGLIREQSVRKKVMGLMVVGIFSIRSFYYIQAITQTPFHPSQSLHGQMILNPHQLKVNGDLLTGSALLEAEGKSERVFFRYTLTSEEEQKEFLELDHVVKVSVEGSIEEIEPARNKGNFDAKNHYLSLGILHSFKIESLSSRKVAVKGICASIENLRFWLLHQVRMQEENQVKQYTLALLLADKSGFDEEVWERYKQLGILHVLAISGLHISLMVSVLQKFFWRCGITREKTDGVLMCFVLFYGFVIGWGISGTRAIGMVILSILLKRWTPLRHHSQLWSLLGMVIGSILLWPGILWNVAFQLSYALSAVILLLSKWQKNVLPKVNASLWIPIGVSVMALPLVCQYFFYWNALSILLTALFSLLFEGVLFPLLTIYLLAVLSGWGNLVDIICFLGEALLLGLTQVLSFCQKFAFTKFTFGIWEPWEWGVYFLLILFSLVRFERRKMTVKKGLFFLGALILLLVEVPYHWGTELIMIDVGQGDSILVLAPGWNQATLIDTGGLSDFASKEEWKRRKRKPQGDTTVIPALQAEGLSELSQVMLSHGDEDHVGNLQAIAKQIKIKEIVIGKGMEKLSLMQQVKRDYPSIRWKLVSSGNEWKWNQMKWQILWPKDVSKGENDDSIVALLTIQKHTVLLTGDASEKVEDTILKDAPNLHFSILKVGHHGSRTSTSEALLKKASPSIALVSCGKNNRYRHPSIETVGRLDGIHAHIFRTDQDGQIRLYFKKEQIEIFTKLSKKYQKLKE